jgi:hypothetical protein
MKRWMQRLRDRAAQRRTGSANTPSAHLRVAEGARYLDDEDPGWYQRVDPETLELSDGRCCVLGQLHGEYRRGLLRTLINASSAPRASLSPTALGFQCVQGVNPAAQDDDYRHLTRAWTAEILRRRFDEAHEPACSPSLLEPEMA